MITQGVILAVLPWAVFLLGFPELGIHVSWNAGSSVCIFLSVIFGYLGLNGINGYSLTQFLKSFCYFSSHRRICYYNPRIKTEACPAVMQKEAEQLLPREKLERIWKKYQGAAAEKNRENAVKAQDEYISDRTGLYFSDDIGIVDKPLEYMTRKEYRQYVRELKKKERSERRAIRLAKKQKRKEEKRKREKAAVSKKEKKRRRRK